MFNLFQEAFSRFTGIYCAVCPFSRATLELSKALSSLRRCPLMTWIWRRRVALSRVPSLKTRLGACLSTPKRCLEQVPRKTYSSLSRRVPLMLFAFGADVENWILYLCDLVWHCSIKTHQALARTHVFFFLGLCVGEIFSAVYFVWQMIIAYQSTNEFGSSWGSPSWLMFSMPRRQPPAALALAATRTRDCYQWNMPKIYYVYTLYTVYLYAVSNFPIVIILMFWGFWGYPPWFH